MPSSDVFHKYGAGQLHSGSKSGPVVKNRKQAIAIFLSEKRKEAQHGGKYPERAEGGAATFKQRFPASAWIGLSPDQGPSIDSAFSNVNNEYPLGNALQTKAARMRNGYQFGGSPVGMGMPPPGMGGMMPGLGGQLPPSMPPSSMSPMLQGFRADGGDVSAADRRRGYRDLASQMSMDRAARNLGQTIQSLDANVAQGISDVVPRGLGDGFQFGGSPTSMGLTPGWIERSEARNIGAMSRPHLGPIVSTVGGRTDNHAISVPSGSYVFPAAHVSAIGQGNTLNGLKVLQGMFGPPMRGGGGGRLPMGRPAPMLKPMAGGMPKGAPFASSGRAPFTSAGGSRGDAHVGKPVDIMAAGGEFVLGPDQVMRGPIDKPWNLPLDKAHAVLDHWVKKKHKEWGKTVTNLPPPAKS